MLYSEQLSQLTDDEHRKFSEALSEMGLTEETARELLQFKIILEGAKFHGTVSGDLAHALWKVQVSYYRMVAFTLYGDQSAVLSTKEREMFQLDFRIENGSTGVFEDLSDSFFRLVDRAFDKMEGWQILAAVVAMAAAYSGSKYFAYLKDKKAIESDERKHQAGLDLDERNHQAELELDERKFQAELAVEERKHHDDREMMRSIISSHKEIFLNAVNAGQEGRRAILKTVSGLDRVVCGDKDYAKEDIDNIRRRAPGVKAQTETRIINVAVEEIDARIKDHPVVILHDKDTGKRFKADLVLGLDDEAELNEVLDLIWSSARYSERYFWAEVSIVSRRDKIESVSVLRVAKEKAELENSSELEDI